MCQILVEKVSHLLAFASDFGAAAGLCSCVAEGPSSRALGSLAGSCWLFKSLTFSHFGSFVIVFFPGAADAAIYYVSDEIYRHMTLPDR